MWFNHLRANWIVLLAATVLVGGWAYLRWTEPPRQPIDARFTLAGPQGKPLVVQLPELARAPLLDLAPACALVAKQNATLRDSLKAAADNARQAAIVTAAIRTAAEEGCVAGAARDFRFYDQLSDALTAPTQKSRADAYQMIAAAREALRAATSAEDVATALNGLTARITARADALTSPDLYLISAEALGLRVMYCVGDPGPAAVCRAQANTRRAQELFDAGRWRADARLLRASIAAARDALRDLPAGAHDVIDLHARIADALAQMSEQEDAPQRSALLREALDEYERAARALDASSRSVAWTESTRAMIDQNVCSIRQPLAALDADRANTRRAIDECERARVHYDKVHDLTSAAGAHYNIARALEKLADWDQDEAAALAAVEHVRQSVQLYLDSGATLSVAFARVHLAQALLDASAFARKRADDESRAKARAYVAEARASLDTAEPALREAKATGYLESLARTRRRPELSE